MFHVKHGGAGLYIWMKMMQEGFYGKIGYDII